MKGSELRDAFLSAANHISNLRQEIDALNVFPVPDGDTGTNMSMTIASAARELERCTGEEPVSSIAHTAASALLRGARGNSGVILSLLFRGFSKGLKGLDEASGDNISDALKIGVQSAYKAVMKPTEGTILTVARLAAEHAQDYCIENPGADALVIFEEIYKAAQDALAQTPELLPVLKKAGVVDAGGRGFVVIIEGMLSVLRDGKIIAAAQGEEDAQEEAPVVEATEESGDEIASSYLAEYTVLRKTDRDPVKLRAYVESIGEGASIDVETDTIKVRVYTDNPGKVLQEGLKFGPLTAIKVENIKIKQEASAQAAQQSQKKTSKFAYVPVDSSQKYGFVAVAAGEGIQNLFRDLGVVNIVSGGQTMNPSTEDILEAVQATPAETVFVLPNNKNIIMAAEQVQKLADRKVCVLPSRTIPQGVCAMLAFDESLDVSENQLNMTKALDNVSTGSLTFAARDSEIDGRHIEQGEIIALENGKLTHSGRDLNKMAIKLTRSMMTKDSAFVTVYYGEDITEEQAQELEAQMKEKLPEDVELTMLPGGQPVYYYIIAVE